MDEGEIRVFTLRYPRWVSHSIAKVDRVVEFLREDLCLDAAQVKKILLSTPAIIGLDVENNLRVKVA